eukprot:gene17366-12416_t
MKNVLSDKDGQIAELRLLVRELQQEKALLLREVECLRQEIDVSTRANAEKVQALMGAPKADAALMKSASLLPADIQQCHADLAAAREQLLDVIDRSEKAQTLVLAEEAALRHDFSMLSASDVDVRIDEIRREIEDTKSVSNENWSKFRDALLNAGAKSDAIAEQKRRIQDLQNQLFLLHKRHTFSFASADDVFSRSRWDLCRLRKIGFTAEDAKDAGFALKNIHEADYTLKE